MEKEKLDNQNKVSLVGGVGIGVFFWGLAILAVVALAVWGVYKVLDKHGGELAKNPALALL